MSFAKALLSGLIGATTLTLIHGWISSVCASFQNPYTQQEFAHRTTKVCTQHLLLRISSPIPSITVWWEWVVKRVYGCVAPAWELQPAWGAVCCPNKWDWEESLVEEQTSRKP